MAAHKNFHGVIYPNFFAIQNNLYILQNPDQTSSHRAYTLIPMVLNLGIMTLLGVTYQMSCISGIYITIHNSNNSITIRSEFKCAGHVLTL